MRYFWTEEEDANLKNAVEACKTQDRIHWKAISKIVGTRTARQCMQRWIDVLRPGIKKGTWSKYEDIILQRVVRLHGFRNWTEIARLIPKRTAKQCRERWHQNLAPHLSKQPFSSEDDELLLKLFANYGSKWTVIAKHFKNRSANLIKCRWKSLHRQYAKNNLKGKIEQMKKLPRNERFSFQNSKNVYNSNSSSSIVPSYPSECVSTIGGIQSTSNSNIKAKTNMSSLTPIMKPPVVIETPVDDQTCFTWSIVPIEQFKPPQCISAKRNTEDGTCACERCDSMENFNQNQNTNVKISGSIYLPSDCTSTNIHYIGDSDPNQLSSGVYMNDVTNQRHYFGPNTYMDSFNGYQRQKVSMQIVICRRNHLNPESVCPYNNHNNNNNNNNNEINYNYFG